jgi:tetratricopeptide (TPR) repeat protein
MPEPPIVPAAAAQELTARVWRLAGKSSRTADETQQLVDLAHEAARQWQAEGSPLSQQRAENALAVAYLKAGDPGSALRHARRAQSLCEQDADSQTPFDRAITLAAAAKALNLTGNAIQALRLIMDAVKEADQLADDERNVFDAIFGEQLA